TAHSCSRSCRSGARAATALSPGARAAPTMVPDGSPRRFDPDRRARGNRRQDPVARPPARGALPARVADHRRYPGRHPAQPCAGRMARRAGRLLADARRAALGGRGQLHRDRAVDAEAGQARGRRARETGARRVRRHLRRLFHRRDRRQDPGRDGALGRALRAAVAGRGRHHRRHARGQYSGGAAGQPLRQPPAAARGADRRGAGVPRARPLGRHPGSRMIPPLLTRPDEVMLELGAGGEQLVARLRAVLSALVLLVPLAGALAGAPAGDTAIGLGAAVFVNAMAQLWLALARDTRAHAWLPWVTCAWDVTTVTGVLVLLSMDDRVAGINSMVVWAFYLLAIAMTTLRNDGRLTLFAGGLAMLQYGALAWVLLATSTPQQLVSVEYGTG